MQSKKKRDEQADLEKELMLNPGKVHQKKKRRRKRLAITIVCELLVLAAIIMVGFQIVRSVGKNNLMSKAEAATPNLVPITAQEV